jgi:RNA polymerase sigma-70 factor, ECF subfamily
MDVQQRESELIQRAIAGDESALELLLERNHVTLVEYVRRHLPQELQTLYDVDDILQDTYFEAFRRIGQFVPVGEQAMYRWLVTIARHRMQILLRAYFTQKRRLNVVEPGDGDAGQYESIIGHLRDLAIHKRTPSKSAARHEVMAAVETALGRLPGEHQQAISLRYLEGISVNESAARMGRTSDAFYMLCRRALELLRMELLSASQYL